MPFLLGLAISALNARTELLREMVTFFEEELLETYGALIKILGAFLMLWFLLPPLTLYWTLARVPGCCRWCFSTGKGSAVRDPERTYDTLDFEGEFRDDPLDYYPLAISTEPMILILQTLMLGTIFIVVTFVAFGSIALGGGFLGKWLKGSKRAQDVLNRIAGTAFVGLAIKLTTTER